MHIVSLVIEKRTEDIPEVQATLTKYGKNIISRLGLHDIDEKEEGLIIIVYNDKESIEEFVETLNSINGANVNYMEV